jgi:subtilase family serine protease
MEEQQDKNSPNFRHWLTPAEVGELYGPADSDLLTIKSWLQSHGFTVGGIYPNNMVMDFSGTAGQIKEAFHTEIHYLDVGGERHIANTSDPQIPEALAPAMVGVASLHNFKPQPMLMPHKVSLNAGSGNYELAPADWQTIYNLTPLYRQGIYGQGQTIVVVEDSDSYSTDWSTYTSTFGLNKYGGSLTTVHPGSNCTDPGTTADDGEADLDVEIASAIAPGATVELASCAPYSLTNGVLLTLENLEGTTPPAVISVSYGECEVISGASENAAFSSAFQSLAASGSSVFVSSGDDGPAGCSGNGSTSSVDGIGINGWGDSNYNVSVGGTDFEDKYNAGKSGPLQSTYWASSNGPSFGSAKSYIPEIPWNDSCAGFLLEDSHGYTTAYGSSGYCNNGGSRTTVAGSGGPSGCATYPLPFGGPTTVNWVSGLCAGYPKPSWQAGISGNPADGVRDIPDVSLFAGNGTWGHYTIVCYSDTSIPLSGGKSCAGAPSSWAGFGGTSVSSPAMAAIQALVDQKWGIRAGLPTPTYYSIANAEFTASGSSCYSSNQSARPGFVTSCVFYDVTQGDIVVNCTTGTGARDCYGASPDGAISTGAITSVALSVGSGGSGYTSTPTCSISAPSNLSAYTSPEGSTLYSGGTQATCTATVATSPGPVTGVTLNVAGVGYTGNAICTISGGGGSGATCTATVAVTTASPSYQPGFGAGPGWDFATGLGSVNAYNLVFNNAWKP